uniref:Uncharacterized protein n=1 Tax=Arundo donax TaxID=35708 RepID=A0A0A8XQQ8_ARUDO
MNFLKFEMHVTESEIGHLAKLTSSYSTSDILLSSFTVKVAGSVISTRPHLSTASLIDPLNITILAFRKIAVVPGFNRSTCSLRAVKRIAPVSSPTRHSAMRAGLEPTVAAGLPPPRAPAATGAELTTLTARVWALVPGLSWSILVKTGFLSAGFSPAFATAVDMAAAKIAGSEWTGGMLR